MNQGSGLMILVAGPYRSGTGDDPEKMAANVRRDGSLCPAAFPGRPHPGRR